MPSTSKKQHNFMEAIAHSPSFAKKAGVPQFVGQDFSNADKGRKFSKGGDTMATKMNPRIAAMMMARKPATATKMSAPPKGMKSGGSASSRADGVVSKGKTKGTFVKMNKGGMSC